MKKTDFALSSMAAYITWLAVFAISVAQLRETAYLPEAIVLQLLILLLLAMAISGWAHDHRMPIGRVALLGMLATVLFLSARIPIGYLFIYNVMWMAIAANFFSQRVCWLFLVAINLIWFGIRSYVWNEDNALLETLLVATFYVFALISSVTAIRAQMANERTQLLNRELLATQHLLSEASRESERTRIARDLHDLLGHHLTALTINLQVASRRTDGEVKQTLDQCYALAKLLLSDVREAVSTLRESPAVDLQEVLSLAVRDIPRLQIDLQVDQDIKLHDVTIAEVLLRCVQEAITNSLRHSQSKTARIAVSEHDDVLHMRIEDDGAGVASLIPGNGLKGMRERIEKLHGNLILQSTPHMRIDIEIPLSSQNKTLPQQGLQA